MKKPYLHSNHEVREWVQHYWLAGASVASHKQQQSRLTELHKAIEDILVGVSWLGAGGFHSQPKVIPNHLLAILATQDVISTETVYQSLGGRYKPSSIKNYTSAARTASRAIHQYIVTHKDEVQADIHKWINSDQDINSQWSEPKLAAWYDARNIYKSALNNGVRPHDLVQLQLPKNVCVNLS